MCCVATQFKLGRCCSSAVCKSGECGSELPLQTQTKGTFVAFARITEGRISCPTPGRGRRGPGGYRMPFAACMVPRGQQERQQAA